MERLGTLGKLGPLGALGGQFLGGAAGVGEAAQQTDQGEQQPLHLQGVEGWVVTRRMRKARSMGVWAQ